VGVEPAGLNSGGDREARLVAHRNSFSAS
jgi:hypothetical protein